MVSPSLPSSDSRLKWRKRKKQKQPEDDDEEEDYDEAAAGADDEELVDPALNSVSGSELVSDHAQQISDFPKALKRSVTRWHPSVIGVVASERYGTNRTGLMIENVSHGQLQALSSVSCDNSSLNSNSENSVYVCIPPALMEGRGVEKRFGDGKIHLIPMHSDWFSPSTVHRLERQVVPHFFSGKSPDHSPEKYTNLRNKIISKYLENPGKRLAFADCQGLVANNELYDLSRIVRFLDNWGIINYMSSSHNRPRMSGSLMSGSLIKEDMNGELIVQTTHLRSIDSLILFDKPKCSVRLEDIGLLSPSTASRAGNSDDISLDLDRKIRERLSEHSCSYCLRPLPDLHYQSQKEADIILCSDCFHDAKFIVGHSSIDFTRTESRKYTVDSEGDCWTDQETLLLLEGLEKYKENWDAIGEHVGTKSKAQCILHFLRLPMDDGSLANIEAMQIDTNGVGHALSYSNANGDASEILPQGVSATYEIPFANTPNPVMSLVAFLANAIGPRVAAACACASLAVLTKGDPRSSCDGVPNMGYQKDTEDQIRNANCPLTLEFVKMAARSGLSAAAMKAKLFADQEEREIQRLSATIINHQLKRLELKLKQFAEVETFLMKQGEQIEKNRQRLSTEKVAMQSNRSAIMNANPNINRPPTMSGIPQQQTFGNNIQQMQYMQQRQQQMYGFGPRLPLSAINPSSSTSTAAPSQQHMMFNNSSSVPNSSNNVIHHSLLRSSSGNNSGGLG